MSTAVTTRIRPMGPADWPDVERIYRDGIQTGEATFETAPPSRAAFDRAHLAEHRVVALLGDEVVGWAALSPTSAREVYAGVAEVSVYVDARARGRGVGSALLGALVESSERHGIWTLQAVMFPENRASLALHRRHGFRKVGRRERIAQRDGRWRDTVLLERRSRVVG
jgi:phosphinothricin acetyltransferase